MLDEAFPRESVTWNGQTLRFGRPTLKTQAAFKEELERGQLAVIMRKRDMMDQAAFAEAMSALSRDCNARIYAWGKPEWVRCVLDTEWAKRMFWHVLVQEVLPDKRSLNPSITPDQMDKLWADLSYPGGNLLEDAYVRLMAPDPNPNAPPGTAEQAAQS